MYLLCFLLLAYSILICCNDQMMDETLARLYNNELCPVLNYFHFPQLYQQSNVIRLAEVSVMHMKMSLFVQISTIVVANPQPPKLCAMSICITPTKYAFSLKPL